MEASFLKAAAKIRMKGFYKFFIANKKLFQFLIFNQQPTLITMKLKIFFIIAFFCIATGLSAQQNPWTKWSWLIGEWKGEGSGQPGQGNGTFSFTPDLDSKILVRKAHSEYPANGNRPATVHDDLLIIYPDFTNNPSKAIYFDNEGHTINYSISYSDKSIVLLSDKIANFPVFRLTYVLLDDKTVDIKFEISQDGEKFMTYLEGKSAKTK